MDMSYEINLNNDDENGDYNETVKEIMITQYSNKMF